MSPVRKMSAPARRCQNVSDCAGISAARSANAMNSEATASARKADSAAEVANLHDDIVNDRARDHRDGGCREHDPPVVFESALPAFLAELSRGVGVDRQERAADAPLLEQRAVRRRRGLDRDDIDQELQRVRILPAVDEHRLFGQRTRSAGRRRHSGCRAVRRTRAPPPARRRRSDASPGVRPPTRTRTPPRRSPPSRPQPAAPG